MRFRLFSYSAYARCWCSLRPTLLHKFLKLFNRVSVKRVFVGYSATH